MPRYTGSRPVVRCDCGHLFCFKCGEPAHDPATCEEIRKFEEMVVNNTDKTSLNFMMEKYAYATIAVGGDCFTHVSVAAHSVTRGARSASSSLTRTVVANT